MILEYRIFTQIIFIQISIVVDCEWSEWKNLTWTNTGTECSQTCGGGSMTYSRYKTVEESYGGKPCTGETTKTETNVCNTQECPSNNLTLIFNNFFDV